MINSKILIVAFSQKWLILVGLIQKIILFHLFWFYHINFILIFLIFNDDLIKKCISVVKYLIFICNILLIFVCHNKIDYFCHKKYHQNSISLNFKIFFPLKDQKNVFRCHLNYNFYNYPKFFTFHLKTYLNFEFFNLLLIF